MRKAHESYCTWSTFQIAVTSFSSRSWGTWPPKGWMQEVTCCFSNRFWFKGMFSLVMLCLFLIWTVLIWASTLPKKAYLWVYWQRYSQLLIICSQHGLLEGERFGSSCLVLSCGHSESIHTNTTANTLWSAPPNSLIEALFWYASIASSKRPSSSNWLPKLNNASAVEASIGTNRWAFEFCCPCLIHPYSFSTCIVLQYLNCALEKNNPFCIQVLAVR